MSKQQIGFVQIVKMAFGFFMVLVYLGMAALFASNFFNWSATPTWTAVRWFFVVVFAAYGIFRGYREITGTHTYGMRTYDKQEDEEQYGTYNDFIKQKDNDDEKK
jgi:hypothetical protein